MTRSLESSSPAAPSSRRAFLGRLAGAAVAPAVIPARSLAEQLSGMADTEGSGLPRLLPGQAADEAFWDVVRAQFPLRDGLVMLNAANLCPAPLPVSDAVTVLTRDVDSDASFQNRAKFSGLARRSVEALAAYVGAAADEVVITRNTSEGNNIVLNGLTFGPGDEVVIWDENHPTNNVAWDVRADRYGFAVRRVTTPRTPAGPDDLTRPFLEALTPRTRVLAVSHVSNVSGQALDAGTLCAEARRRGVLTLLDGAQVFGAFPLDLHALGCDFYTASSHKWLMGPKEAGILYVRKELAADLWPSIVGVGWEGARDSGARRFSTLGQRDDATVAAMATAVAFHERIGTERVGQRVRELVTELRRVLEERVTGIDFVTPADPAMNAGVVIFEVEGLDTRAAYNALYEDHGIAGAATGGIRMCPHIYNSLAQMEQAAVAVVAVARSLR